MKKRKTPRTKTGKFTTRARHRAAVKREKKKTRRASARRQNPPAPRVVVVNANPGGSHMARKRKRKSSHRRKNPSRKRRSGGKRRSSHRRNPSHHRKHGRRRRRRNPMPWTSLLVAVGAGLLTGAVAFAGPARIAPGNTMAAYGLPAVLAAGGLALFEKYPFLSVGIASGAIAGGFGASIGSRYILPQAPSAALPAAAATAGVDAVHMNAVHMNAVHMNGLDGLYPPADPNYS